MGAEKEKEMTLGRFWALAVIFLLISLAAFIGLKMGNGVASEFVNICLNILWSATVGGVVVVLFVWRFLK